ncbi:ATP-binding cassette domain-containing protein [Bifidobacterium miconis]|nr:ATP-binding cassette domain-containing protein [Bifidobacterium miconis]
MGVRAEHITYRYPAADDSSDDDNDAIDGVDGNDTTSSGTTDTPARLALDDISLDIAPESIVAFVGENGSGKTTLAKIIAGILEPDSGTVTLPRPNDANVTTTLGRLGAQWGGIGLSGGQWQRLALARTFLSDQPLWILDEPTAAVDATAEAAIYHDLTENRPAGTTVIVTSHRPHVLTHVDRIVVLDRGRVAESGTYDQLIAKRGRFSQLAHDSLE